MHGAKELCVHACVRAQPLARRQSGAAAVCLVDARSREAKKRMTTFDKREEGFENQFVHDEELRFKAMARRNKMLGLWAAGLLGKSAADAEAYAKDVVLAEFDE